MGFLQANIELALERPDVGPELVEYLRKLVRTRGLA
jgi:UTP-glucose-1-phosphate uridylyltransferase